MAEQKIFAGPRIRRIRNGKGLTQTAMAEGLGISPSYLNLIERNQRPLTVQLVAQAGVGLQGRLEELQGDGDSVGRQLKEVFADPLLSGELPGDQELIEVAEAAPNAAAAMVKLFRAYREQAERLSDLSELLAREGRATALSGAQAADRRGARDVRAPAQPFSGDRGRGGSLHRACSTRATICPAH